ncbi:MAG: class I SAM-dependent methyltransferase [Pseudomonadota bacterium]
MTDLSAPAHGSETATAWVRRFSPLIAAGGQVLDLACGTGRHARFLSALGHPVVLVDRSAEALAEAAAGLSGPSEVHVADLESGPWPFSGRQFAGLVITNYLWRPLFPAILTSLQAGGVLIYETFADGNETVGRPSRPDFLLRPGELLDVCRGLRVIAFEDGYEFAQGAKGERFVQRIAAVSPIESRPGQPPARYPIA